MASSLKRVSADALQDKLAALTARKVDLESKIPRVEMDFADLVGKYNDVRAKIADLQEELALGTETKAEENARQALRDAPPVLIP